MEENTLRGKREWSFTVEKCRSMGLGQVKWFTDSGGEKTEGNAVVHLHTAGLLTSPTPTITPQPHQTHNPCTLGRMDMKESKEKRTNTLISNCHIPQAPKSHERDSNCRNLQRTSTKQTPSCQDCF